MSADAGLLGFGGDSWKEEVLLHDGSRIIVERSQSYGRRHEVGQSPPIKEQDITFTLPSTSKTIEFKSEYGEDIGRANFKLLAAIAKTAKEGQAAPKGLEGALVTRVARGVDVLARLHQQIQQVLVSLRDARQPKPNA
jgi:hypothetical protein